MSEMHAHAERANPPPQPAADEPKVRRRARQNESALVLGGGREGRAGEGLRSRVPSPRRLSRPTRLSMYGGGGVVCHLKLREQ